MVFPKGFSIALHVSPSGGTDTAPPVSGINAVYFDGTNDWLSRDADLTGNANGPAFTMSFWFKCIGNDGVGQAFVNATGSNQFKLSKTSSNFFSFICSSVTPVTLWQWTHSATAYSSVSNPGWHHMLVAAELDATPVGQIYIDDTLVIPNVENGPITGDIDFTATDWGIGGFVPGGTAPADLEMAEVYLAQEYIDISVEANRRKFISATSKPVSLGADGSIPTGTTPIMFFSGPTASWHTNKGSGSGFTENGALTDATSSPAD